MKGWKKPVAVVLLLLVIVGMIAFMVRRVTHKPPPPDWVMKSEVMKIDVDTFETVTLTIAEWRKLGEKGERFKNPETGKFTMVDAFRCTACGEAIPEPKPSQRGKYVCPRCGKKAD